MTFYRLRYGFKRGSVVPFKNLLEEGELGAGTGLLSATSTASDQRNHLTI